MENNCKIVSENNKRFSVDAVSLKSEILKSKENRKKLVIAVYIAFIIAQIVQYIVIEILGLRPQCPIHQLTGLSCITCGLTRMVEALLDFNILQAFRWNPYVFLQVPFIVAAIYKATRDFIELGRFKKWTYKAATIWIGIGILFMVARNLPAFSFLLPTEI